MLFCTWKYYKTLSIGVDAQSAPEQAPSARASGLTRLLARCNMLLSVAQFPRALFSEQCAPLSTLSALEAENAALRAQLSRLQSSVRVRSRV